MATLAFLLPSPHTFSLPAAGSWRERLGQRPWWPAACCTAAPGDGSCTEGAPLVPASRRCRSAAPPCCLHMNSRWKGEEGRVSDFPCRCCVGKLSFMHPFLFSNVSPQTIKPRLDPTLHHTHCSASTHALYYTQYPSPSSTPCCATLTVKHRLEPRSRTAIRRACGAGITPGRIPSLSAGEAAGRRQVVCIGQEPLQPMCSNVEARGNRLGCKGRRCMM